MLKIGFTNGQIVDNEKLVLDIFVSEFRSFKDFEREILSAFEPGEGEQIKVETVHIEKTDFWELKWALDQKGKSIEVFEDYFKIRELIDDDEKEKVFSAYLELIESDEITVRDAKWALDSYVGWYESDEDFARDHYDSQCNYSIPVEILDYVDWDSVWENELSSDYSQYDGYFFENY